jgi:hypothetical protein
MELLQRARESGRVIPSLVTTDNGGTIEVDGFGPDLLALLDGTGTLEALRFHDWLKIPNSVSLPHFLWFRTHAGFHLSPAKTTGDAFVELLKVR